MGFKAAFKNFGHAMATAAKYTVVGLKDVILFANKAQAVAPEVDAVVGALAGPQAAVISDLAFHALGDIATAIEKLPADVQAVSDSHALNLSVDAQFVNDVKAALPLLKSIVTSVGAQLPKP